MYIIQSGLKTTTNTIQITTALLEAGFTQEQLGRPQLSKVAQIMSENLARQNGIVGFGMFITSRWGGVLDQD